MQNWSDELQQLTIRCFRDGSFQWGPDGVAMKHRRDRSSYGLIGINDAIAERIVIQLRDGSGEERFDTIEDAVKAGWAID